VVVGVPDEHWGALVTAVVAGDDVPALAQVREHVAARLGRHHAPRALVRLPELPLRGPGKVDRLAAARLATELLAAADPRAERMPPRPIPWTPSPSQELHTHVRRLVGRCAGPPAPTTHRPPPRLPPRR